MKDSGIEWIGQIPTNWDVVPHKRVMHKVKEICEQYNGEDIISLTMNGVIKRDLTAGGKMPTSFDGYQYVKPNDLLLCLFDIDVTPRCVGVVKDYGVTSPAYSRFVIHDGYYNAYYDYLLRAIDDDKVFVHLSKNLRSSLTENDFGAIKTCVPPLAEQERIAAFLDAECAEIDAVLEKTRASIEEYKKLKQAVITQAVTKGVRGDRPMKDSGIEWIGAIPAEWSVVKGRRLILATQNGLTRRDLEKSEGCIVLKLKNIDADGNIDYSEVNRVTLTAEEKSKYQLCDGDFLFVRVNGSRNLVGKCTIYHDVGEIVAYNDHIIRVKLNDLCLKEYFHYYLLSIAGKGEIDLHTSTAAGQFTISGDGLRELRVVLPGIVEQSETVAYLGKKSGDIDALIAKKQQYLTEIENYKKSLIYEYVTGKKEVHPL